ncbi:MAG: thermonuclease family protein [Alphaproteobacteria bacterium]
MKHLRIYAFLFVVSLCLWFAAPSFAGNQLKFYQPIQTKPDDLELIDVGTVIGVTKSDVVQLDKHRTFHLDNVRVPPVYENPAREYLTKKLVGQKVGVYRNKTLPDEGRQDKQGYEIIHMVINDGTWVQAALINDGYAWADSTEYNRDLVSKLYSYEIDARAKKRGFWKVPALSVKNEKQMRNNTVGTYQVFEGPIFNYRTHRGFDYLNFSSDFHLGFTLVLNRERYGIFKAYFNPEGAHVGTSAYGFNPYTWGQARVRVRGWVIESGGPMIELTHPEQLEFPDGYPGNTMPVYKK